MFLQEEEQNNNNLNYVFIWGDLNIVSNIGTECWPCLCILKFHYSDMTKTYHTSYCIYKGKVILEA